MTEQSVIPPATAEELRRLRSLVGHDEASYDQLRSDREAAEQVAKGAESELGQLRGRIVELEAEIEQLRARITVLADEPDDPTAPRGIRLLLRRRDT
jgi:predicted  nucleic acid-binding Zn-ribbon protein